MVSKIITFVKATAKHGDLLEDEWLEKKIHKKYNNDRAAALKSEFKEKLEKYEAGELTFPSACVANELSFCHALVSILSAM